MPQIKMKKEIFMAAQEPLKDLEVVQTDTKTLKVNFKDKTGAAIDITGYVLFLTVKVSLNDADTNAKILKTVVCPNNADSQAGNGFISLSSTDTNIAIANYVYDIKFQKNISGNIDTRRTIAIGTFRVNATGTKRTS